jgi:hypothetical protein
LFLTSTDGTPQRVEKIRGAGSKGQASKGTGLRCWLKGQT